jgi:hypothetical protein
MTEPEVQITEQDVVKPKLELTNETINELIQIRKWTTFFSVLGFVVVALLAFVGIILVLFMSKLGNTGTFAKYPLVLVGLFYLGFAVLYFVPVLYLHRFSVKSQKAIVNNDSATFQDAFTNLKKHYQFIGVLTIIIIAIYIIVLLGVLFVKMVS